MSLQRRVGLGTPCGLLLQAPTHPASPSQEAVPATECRWPPWKLCCHQPSKRAWELSLNPAGRSSGRECDFVEMLMLVEWISPRATGPDPTLMSGEYVRPLARDWDIFFNE